MLLDPEGPKIPEQSVSVSERKRVRILLVVTILLAVGMISLWAMQVAQSSKDRHKLSTQIAENDRLRGLLASRDAIVDSINGLAIADQERVDSLLELARGLRDSVVVLALTANSSDSLEASPIVLQDVYETARSEWENHLKVWAMSQIQGGNVVVPPTDDSVRRGFAEDYKCSFEQPGVVRGRVRGRLWLDRVYPGNDRAFSRQFVVLGVWNELGVSSNNASVRQLNDRGEFQFTGVEAGKHISLVVLSSDLEDDHDFVVQDQISDDLFGECVDMEAPNRPKLRVVH